LPTITHRQRNKFTSRLRAVAGHAISFWTWRSLCLDHGLSDTEAVDAMTGMVLGLGNASKGTIDG